LINKIENGLIDIASILELELDFSEEEINPLPKIKLKIKLKILLDYLKINKFL